MNLKETLNSLCEQQRDYGQRVGWEANTHGEGLMLIVAELAEAMEDVRMGLPVNEMHYEGDKPCGIPSEMADVVLRVATFCGFRGIDLGAAVEAKLRYNETRGHRHGGKLL